MIQKTLRILIEPTLLENSPDVRKSRLLSIFLLVLILVFTAVDLVSVLTIPGYQVPWYGYGFLMVAYGLNRFSYYRTSALLCAFMFPAVVFAGMLNESTSEPVASLGFLLVGLIMAGIFVSRTVLILLAVFDILGILALYWVLPEFSPDTDSLLILLAITAVGAILTVISLYHRDQEEADRQVLLRNNEERYRMLFEEAPDGIMIIDANNRILMANAVMYQMTGYTPTDVIGHSPTEFVAPDDLIKRPPRPLAAIQVPGSMKRERIIICKDGRRLNVIVSSSYMPDGHLQYIIQDMTERKRMEEALRLSEERYRLVSSVISDYTFSNMQNEKGEIVLNWVAGAFEQISGYTVDEFNERGGWSSTVHPDDRERDARDIDALKNNQRVVSELRTIHKDGSIRWVRSYAHPIWDPGTDTLIGIYGAVQDITEQKRIERERERLFRELEAKNVELEQFTYTVSHDLKAPLITIKGFLGLLAEDARSGDLPRLEGDIRRIREAADKMHTLLNDLLELSRIGRLMNDPQEVNCNLLIHDVEKTLAGRFRDRRVRLRIHGTLPVVMGDYQRLSEVFQNLLDNASKFMGDQPEPLIEVGCRESEAAGFVTFYVKDNGIGVPLQHQERIFGLFNRLDPNVEGTGIGLTLVKRIVEFHNGRIWLDSEVGKGTTFYFTLPSKPTPER